MAITKPNLDQLTGSIDAFVGSFDSDADLLRADFTKEPTLEELDSIIANFDALDSFGNVDSLSFDFFSVAATASLTVTGTAAIQFAIPMSAAASVAVTANNAFDRIRGVDAAVTGAVSIAATASFIARMSAAASVAVTATNVANRVRGMGASASVAVTGTANFVTVLSTSATADAAVTASGAATGVFSMPATGAPTVTATAIGKIPGEDWSEVADGSETWTVQTAGTEVWATQTGNTRDWLTQ